MNKKNNWMYIVGAIVLIILAGLLAYKAFQQKKIISAQDSRIEALKGLREDCRDELVVANNRADSLQTALDACCPKPKPLTLEEKVNWLFEHTQTTTTTRTQRPKAPAPKPDVAEKNFGSGGGFSTGNISKTTDTASDTYGGSKVTFSGKIPDGSKFGITTTVDRFRLYYILDKYLKENGMTVSAPRLNGADGPEFSFDTATGYWYYLDSSTLMSASVVNNWDYMVIWCVYIGRIGTWDAFLPHESMKALMKKVRGKEDGAVTMNELYEMNKLNSEVWTDQNKNGSLMPKSFNPISGEVERGTKTGPEDGKIYQGWDFRCRTTGEVITEKVSGSSGSYQNTTK